MADSTTSAIDRLFDFVDGGVEKIDRVLNRGKYTEEQHHARRGKRPDVIDAAPTRKMPKKPSSSTSALARKPRFYIVESISSSGTLFVVTDGGSARTECSTREFANKILAALEKSQ